MDAKRVAMNLENENGNAFHLLGAFAHQARQSGWKEAKIASVSNEAMAGDYAHLLQTIQKYVDHPQPDNSAPEVQMMIDALVRIREKTAKGPDGEFDRESYTYHLWSQSDHEIYQLCDEALHAAGIDSFKDDRMATLPDSE